MIGRDGTGSASSSSLSSEVEVVISKGGLAGTVESEGREGGEEKRREKRVISEDNGGDITGDDRKGISPCLLSWGEAGSVKTVKDKQPADSSSSGYAEVK